MSRANVAETVVPIRWRDMDAFGHVNHATYLTYLEEGRDAAITRVLGKAGYVVARLCIDYRRELTLVDGPVTIACWFTTLGNASLGTRETIRSASGDLAAESEAVIVKFDRYERRSQAWTEYERQSLIAAGALPNASAGRR